LLIQFGAHIDCVNRYDQTPLDITQLDEVWNLLKVKQLPSRLKCLCARMVVEKQLPYELIWPKETEMNTFLFLHDSLAKQSKDNSTHS